MTGTGKKTRILYYLKFCDISIKMILRCKNHGWQAAAPFHQLCNFCIKKTLWINGLIGKTVKKHERVKSGIKDWRQSDMHCTSSRLNSTPPIGAPNATLTPAAAAADRIWNKNNKYRIKFSGRDKIHQQDKITIHQKKII